MDFNGLVRHYYLRQGDDVAEVRINLAGKKNRRVAEPRHRPADATRPAGHCRSASRADETRGDAAGTAGDRQRGRRGLRPAGQSLRRPPAGRRYGAGASGGGAGRGRRRRRARGRPAEDDLRHRQGKGRLKRHYHRADRRHAAGGAGRQHGGPGAERHRAQSAADRIARARRSDRTSAADLAQAACQREQRPAGAAGRVGSLGHRPRRPDDLPQEPPARGLRVRRRPPAGRRPTWWWTCWRTGRMLASLRPMRRRNASATAGSAETAPRPVAERTFFSNGSGIAWGVPRGVHGRLCRRGRVEDHARRVPRPGSGLRRGDDRHLRPVGGSNRLVRHPAGRHAGDSA